MKKNWIKRGTPAVAIVFLIAIGVMSCSTDPMSSQDNGSSTYAIETTVSVPKEATTMETPETVKLLGHLRMDISGECWYLIVRPGEVYELRLLRRLRSEVEGRDAAIEGTLPTILQPRCSSWPVLKVMKLELMPE